MKVEAGQDECGAGGMQDRRYAENRRNADDRRDAVQNGPGLKGRKTVEIKEYISIRIQSNSSSSLFWGLLPQKAGTRITAHLSAPW